MWDRPLLNMFSERKGETMNKIKTFHVAMIVVGLFLGLILAIQFRVTRDIQKIPQVNRAQTLVSRVNDARQERDHLQDRIAVLREQLDKVAAGAELGTLKGELMTSRIEAGLSGVTGPGIEVTLNDSNMAVQPGGDPNLYVLHDEDVLKVLNELKAAGAEALAINNQRIIATSEIRCIGPTILTNKNQRLAPPFIITAIGNQDNMINSLKMRSGVIEALQYWGIQVSVKKISRVAIPAYTGGIKFDYARPLEAKEGQR